MDKGTIARLRRKSRSLPCPVCGFWVPRRPLLRQPFSCPNCGRQLRVAKIRGIGLFFELTVSAMLAALLPYLVGVRGLYLVVTALVAFFPVLFLVASVAVPLFGRLETCSGR